ncbi:MAG: CesT family type III secretion system chaperone [Ramlibacter sp.]|nr:CesT family type III secretion system chaperone [Ramlibacter sp.]
MTDTRFRTLCVDLCDLLAVPRFELADAFEGSVAFHLVRNGVTVNVLYFPQSCADHVFCVFEFGAIPYDDPRAPDIVLALLDANFLIPDPNPPALGRNPVSGDIVLRCVHPMAHLSAQALLDKIDKGVALANQWRADYFLEVQPLSGDAVFASSTGVPA